jgi:hypothetical protein
MEVLQTGPTLALKTPPNDSPHICIQQGYQIRNTCIFICIQCIPNILAYIFECRGVMHIEYT